MKLCIIAKLKPRYTITQMPTHFVTEVLHFVTTAKYIAKTPPSKASIHVMSTFSSLPGIHDVLWY